VFPFAYGSGTGKFIGVVEMNQKTNCGTTISAALKNSPHDDHQVAFTLFRDLFHNDANYQGACSWRELVSDLSNHEVLAAKECCHAVSGWTFRTKRRTQDAIQIHLLILDFDGSMSVKGAQVRFQKYEHILYTTWSHQAPKKGEKDRFRVVLPLARPLTKNEYLDRTDMLAQVGIHADDVWQNPAQIYFLPACPISRQHLAVNTHNTGELFDLLGLPENVVQKPELASMKTRGHKITRNWTNSDVVDALSENGRLEYDDWFHVGCAMYTNEFTEQEFREATQLGMKPSRSESQISQQWRNIESFCRGKSAFSMGVIFNILKK